MRILFISDIHGKIENLDFLNNTKFDELICLGDISSYGYSIDDEENDNLIIKKLLKYKEKLICLKGNCDWENYSLFTPNDYIKFSVDNLNIICNHGDKYSYSRGFPKDTNGILIYGHEHTPYIKKVDNNYFICVGSVSKPRNGSSKSYLIYENNTFTLYDINNNIIDYINIK